MAPNDLPRQARDRHLRENSTSQNTPPFSAPHSSDATIPAGKGLEATCSAACAELWLPALHRCIDSRQRPSFEGTGAENAVLWHHFYAFIKRLFCQDRLRTNIWKHAEDSGAFCRWARRVNPRVSDLRRWGAVDGAEQCGDRWAAVPPARQHGILPSALLEARPATIHVVRLRASSLLVFGQPHRQHRGLADQRYLLRPIYIYAIPLRFKNWVLAPF